MAELTVQTRVIDERVWSLGGEFLNTRLGVGDTLELASQITDSGRAGQIGYYDNARGSYRYLDLARNSPVLTPGSDLMLGVLSIGGGTLAPGSTAPDPVSLLQMFQVDDAGTNVGAADPYSQKFSVTCNDVPLITNLDSDITVRTVPVGSPRSLTGTASSQDGTPLVPSPDQSGPASKPAVLTVSTVARSDRVGLADGSSGVTAQGFRLASFYRNTQHEMVKTSADPAGRTWVLKDTSVLSFAAFSGTGYSTQGSLLRVRSQSQLQLGLGSLAVLIGTQTRVLGLGAYHPAGAPAAENLSGSYLSLMTRVPYGLVGFQGVSEVRALAALYVAGQDSGGQMQYADFTGVFGNQVQATVLFYDGQGVQVSDLGLALSYQLRIELRSQHGLRLSSFKLGFTASNPIETVLPQVLPGLPTQSTDWLALADEYPLRVRWPAGSRRMRRHPLTQPFADVQLRRKVSNQLLPVLWEDANWLVLPSDPGTGAELYFHPNGALSGVTASAAASRQALLGTPIDQPWGNLEWRFSSYQLYSPSIKVSLVSVNPAGGELLMDLSHQVESLQQGRLTLSGPYQPELDSLLSKDGAGIRCVLDGVAVEFGLITGATKTSYLNGRVWLISFAEALDYHNYDMEQISSAYFDPRHELASLTMVGREDEYLRIILDQSGFSNAGQPGFVVKDPGVQFRNTGFWEAQPAYGGYGGVLEDRVSAYSGHGGSISQEVEQVANANLSKPFLRADGVLRFAPIIPQPDLNLAALLHSDQTHRYNSDVSGDYLPDTRVLIDAGGFDLQAGYALVEVEGQSNLVSTNGVGSVVSFLQNGKKVETLTAIHYGGTPGGFNFNQYWPQQGFWRQGSGGGTILNNPEITINYDGANYAAFQTTEPSGSFASLAYPVYMQLAGGYGQPEDSQALFPFQSGEVKHWSVQVPIGETRPGMPSPIGAVTGYDRNSVDFGFYPGNAAVGSIEYVVETPAAINQRLSASGNSRSVPENWGACITGLRVKFTLIQDGSGYYNFIEKYDLKVSAFVPEVDGSKILPYRGTGQDGFSPAWYPGLMAEANSASRKRMMKRATTQNPFVVDLALLVNGTLSPFMVGKLIPQAYLSGSKKYSSAEHLATGLNLWEWLHTRSMKLSYVGGPAWMPGQFVAVARRPAAGPGSRISQWDVYMVLEPSRFTLSVGQDVSTDTRVGYVGCTDGLTRGGNLGPTSINLFREEGLLPVLPGGAQ